MKRYGKTILIYLALLILLMALTFWASQDVATICWDGVEVDEALLMELCGISEAEYWEMDPADCPQSVEALTMIGGCEPDYSVVAASMVLVALIYSLLFMGVVWFRRQRVRSEFSK